jgi:hypothetical protein
MVDYPMGEFVIDKRVRLECIRVEVRSLLNILPKIRFDRVPLAVFQNLRTDDTAAFENPHHDSSSPFWLDC